MLPLTLVCTHLHETGSLSLLLLLLAVARATPGAVLPKAAGQPPYPLDLKLSVTRSGDKAVGNATITNTLNQTASVSDACSGSHVVVAEGWVADADQQLRLMHTETIGSYSYNCHHNCIHRCRC